jgi:hypothetical protein
VERLEQVFELIGKRLRARPATPSVGIVEEGQEVMKEYRDSPALDAGLLAGVEAISERFPERTVFTRFITPPRGEEHAGDLAPLLRGMAGDNARPPRRSAP